MTRINLVHVQDLADQHLFAEWREIKMVPAALRRSLKTRSVKDIMADIPKKFTLNAGHVSFFFNKMNFLINRYTELTYELVDRNYDISDHNSTDIFFTDIPDEFKTAEWCANKDDIVVSAERIMLRIGEKPDWYKYYGKTTSPDYFKALYDLHIAQSC